MSTIIYYVQINITCIIIIGMIWFSIPRYHYNSMRDRYFNFMLITAVIFCLSDLIAGSFRGAVFAGARELLWISNIVYSASIVLLAYEWVLFSLTLMNRRINSHVIWIIGLFGIVILFANITTPITGLLFNIDEHNLYYRGPWIYINWAYVYTCQLLPIPLMFWTKANERERKAILLYPVFPLIASIVQMFFYGVSAGQVGATCSIVLVYVVLQGREVKKQRREAERLAIESEIANAANEAKGRFLANMSHEIRTPINAVLGMDTMILRESRESHTKEYAMNIYTAGHTLLSLVNDILDISKIESGKMEIIPVQYDFATLINDVFNMIRIKAEDKSLAVHINVDRTLPSRLTGDDVRIRQILVNIMSNAVKYTESGSVTLSVNGTVEDDTVHLHFSVIDTGIGIKDADIEKLFSDYERLDEERNRKIEGTGLGISITAHLLELMNSKLQVNSVYGEGSEFYFDLDQKINNYEVIGDFTARALQKAENYEYTALFTASEAKVLVVDDNKMNRDVLCGLLKETEISIDQASSGAQALQMITDNSYDIVLLDHMMPDMDGIEVLKKVRNGELADSRTVFIALTANAISGAREYYLNAGFDAYLSKPIIPDMLEKLLKKYIAEDKIHTAEVAEISTETKGCDTEDSLPIVEGIDWNFAKLHYNNKASLFDAINIFYNMIIIEADELASLYDIVVTEVDNNTALDNYRIKVHAMKNEANLIGAYFLGGVAAMLEYAARDGKAEQVIQITPYFIQSWSSYREKLKTLVKTDDDSAKVELTAEQSDEIINKVHELIDAMQNFDVHTADDIIVKLGQYKYQGEAEELFEKMKGYVGNLDSDNVEAIGNRFIQKINKL